MCIRKRTGTGYSDYKTLKAQVKALEQKLALIVSDLKILNEDNITVLCLLFPCFGIPETVNVNTENM